MSASKIGLMFGVSKKNVCLMLHKCGVPIRPCRGSNHPMWKGGRVKLGSTMGGHQIRYWAVWVPNHPRADHRGYVKEHILIMERKLGRSIKKSEVIHHINHDMLDNRPENLALFGSHSEHIEAERSLETLIKPLIEGGVICFNGKKYELVR